MVCRQNPPVLPPEKERPPLTAHIKALLDHVTQLNVLLRSVEVGLAALADVTLLPPALPNVAPALQALQNYAGITPATVLQNARSMFLVELVSRYEWYLRETIVASLASGVLVFEPGDRIRVDVAPQQWGNGPGLNGAFADQIIATGYRERAGRVNNVFSIIGSEHNANLVDVALACLFRNAIVHGGGRVDGRVIHTLQEAHRLGPLAVALNDPLPLTDHVWRRLSGALLEHAKDVDLYARV